MREDMFKVIVERPRSGRWPAKGRRRGRRLRLDDDGEPIHGRPERTKYLNENLAPLSRFLEKNVGRPWNKVFSEICENLSVASAVQKHVRDHLEDFVELHVVLVDGVPCDPARERPFAMWRWAARRRRYFYVCPRTGLLRRIEPLPERTKSAPVTSVAIDAEHTYEQVDGLWFRVRWVDAGATPRWCLVAKKLVGAPRWGKTRCAVEKRQCGKKELAEIRARTS